MKLSGKCISTEQDKEWTIMPNSHGLVKTSSSCVPSSLPGVRPCAAGCNSETNKLQDTMFNLFFFFKKTEEYLECEGPMDFVNDRKGQILYSGVRKKQHYCMLEISDCNLNALSSCYQSNSSLMVNCYLCLNVFCIDCKIKKNHRAFTWMLNTCVIQPRSFHDLFWTMRTIRLEKISVFQVACKRNYIFWHDLLSWLAQF